MSTCFFAHHHIQYWMDARRAEDSSLQKNAMRITGTSIIQLFNYLFYLYR